MALLRSGPYQPASRAAGWRSPAASPRTAGWQPAAGCRRGFRWRGSRPSSRLIAGRASGLDDVEALPKSALASCSDPRGYLRRLDPSQAGWGWTARGVWRLDSGPLGCPRRPARWPTDHASGGMAAAGVVATGRSARPWPSRPPDGVASSSAMAVNARRPRSMPRCAVRPSATLVQEVDDLPFMAAALSGVPRGSATGPPPLTCADTLRRYTVGPARGWTCGPSKGARWTCVRWRGSSGG